MPSETGKESLLEDGAGQKNGNVDTSPSSSYGQWALDIVRPAILTKKTRKFLIPTAYLDGLRGFAAFLVYWQHHQVWARVSISASNIFENVYGHNGNYYFACIPGIRIFFTGGHVAVSVFFVISGHVLSTKALKQIYNQDYAKLNETIASALFRRWLRLFIPAAATTFIYFTSWHLFGIWTAYPDHQKTYSEEVWHWYKMFKNFSFIWSENGREDWFTYNFHLWSIPIEFKGSVVVYALHLALSRCSTNIKLLTQAFLMWYFLYMVDGWYCAMFVAGATISELDLLSKRDKVPGLLAAAYNKMGRFKQLFWYWLFLSGIYLSGVPAFGMDFNNLRNSPGWYYLSFLRTPGQEIGNEEDPKWFYLFIASSFIVASVPNIRPLKRFFETRFCQYLGHISYALYLVHGPVLWTLSDRIYYAVGWTRDFKNDGLHGWENLFPLSKEGPLGLEPSFLLPHLIILPVTLWLAEIATKLFDEPAVRFANWFYRRSLSEQFEGAISK
jgi:peptidoglycan/LPS O-acetylase OafA/YrhL